MHLIPSAQARILDIGSGPGHDAAAFAAMGHRVVAVEPTEQLRLPAMAPHPSPLIEWVDDSLPHLRSVAESGDTFDLVMLSAVWMHFDERQRRTAMPVVASVLTASGTLIMSLRHGPVPSVPRLLGWNVKTDKAMLRNEVTTIDNALTRPWTVMKTYRRDLSGKPIWLEYVCAEGNRHVVVGKQNYFVSGDGFLMPTRKDQRAPDPRALHAAGQELRNHGRRQQALVSVCAGP